MTVAEQLALVAKVVEEHKLVPVLVGFRKGAVSGVQVERLPEGFGPTHDVRVPGGIVSDVLVDNVLVSAFRPFTGFAS